MKPSAFLLFVALSLFSCQTVVETFDDVEECALYVNPSGKDGLPTDTVTVATYNIRFGMLLLPWFADACGSRVLMTEQEAASGTDEIVRAINEIDADILLLQEVDIDSKRSNYIDQMQALLKGTLYKYAAYASNWKAQIIPSDGLGRVDEGNAVFSKYPIRSATRYQLPLRNDIDALTRLFYVRECVMAVEIEIPGASKRLVVLNTHLSAFATDDTKKRQLDMVLSIADSYRSEGKEVIIGGDFNLLPPNAIELDYCDEDKCEGESFHQADDDPKHKDGSNYEPEITWMQPFYESYFPAITFDEHTADPSRYFSHAVDVSKPYDRYIDHLFASSDWVLSSGATLNSGVWRTRSDHAPVVAKWRVP